MRKIAIILTLLVVGFLPWVQASDAIPASSNATTSHLVAKKAWMENIQNKLPAMLCEKDHYFMKCFSVTQAECTDFNKLFVQACLNNIALALPPELNENDSKHWSAVMGKCSYDLFEKFVQSKKLNTPDCKEVKKEEPKKNTTNEQPKK